MELPASDRRVQLWERFGPSALRNFKKTSGAQSHVLILIDVAEPAGEALTRAMHQCFKKSTEGFDPDKELARLKSLGLPCVVTLPLEQTIEIFTRVGSKIAPGLPTEPDPGSVRVIIVSKGVCLLHDVLPVPPEGLN